MSMGKVKKYLSVVAVLAAVLPASFAAGLDVPQPGVPNPWPYPQKLAMVQRDVLANVDGRLHLMALDSVGQNLSAAGLHLDLVRMDLEGSPEIAARIHEIQHSLEEMMQQLRSMGTLPVETLGRYVLTRERLGELIAVLQRAAAIFDEARRQGGPSHDNADVGAD